MDTFVHSESLTSPSSPQQVTSTNRKYLTATLSDPQVMKTDKDKITIPSGNSNNCSSPMSVPSTTTTTTSSKKKALTRTSSES